MSGFFLVTRGISKHHLFRRKPDRVAVWMWLLDNAAWKETTHDVKGHAVVVPRGSVCVSERHIAEQCGVGYQVVRTAIKRFKAEHMINATPTHGKNLISLCNYEKHQSPQGRSNALVNATPTQPQRNPNAQKEQGNKVTKDTNVSLDASVAEILRKCVPSDDAENFVAFRREIKKPMTQRSAQAMVNMLTGHHDPSAVLNNSISNGWQGIFPDKTPKPNSGGDGRTFAERDDERAKRAADRWLM